MVSSVPVRRRSGRVKDMIKLQNTSLIGDPTVTVCALSSFKSKRDLIPKGQNTSLMPNRDLHVYCRKSIHTCGENSTKMGECSQVKRNNNNVIIRDGEVNCPIWSGSISVSHENFGVVDGLEAYISSRASVEVLDGVKLLPALLDAQVLPRLDIWPANFQERPPTEDIIDLYIVPINERSEADFNRFLDAITREDVVLKAEYADVSILIFSSLQLTFTNWRTNSGKYYLWAVLERKNSFFLHCQEDNSSKLNNGFDIPILHLSNELQLVTEENEVHDNPERINRPIRGSASLFFPHCQEYDFSKMNFVDVPIFYSKDVLQPVTENQDNRERVDGLNQANNFLLEAENHPIGREGETPEQQNGEKGTISIYRNPQSSGMEVEVSESIGGSVLQMAKNFDDETYGEETSSPFAVDPKHARTLSAILEKHGDITRDCVVKCPKMCILALERICATVEDLQNMRFGDLRRRHLESMLSVISDAELMKLDVKWLRSKYEEFLEVIERVKEYENTREKRKQIGENVAVKKTLIAWKKDEMLKIEVEIHKLESEAAEAKQEKQRLRSELTKCKQLSHISLVHGLI
ncbi:hypothetical protein M5689_024143 [Euphorbia peplus]|nr:hypothetical protein M5689_024143 [Euphorbia peplus]